MNTCGRRPGGEPARRLDRRPAQRLGAGWLGWLGTLGTLGWLGWLGTRDTGGAVRGGVTTFAGPGAASTPGTCAYRLALCRSSAGYADP